MEHFCICESLFGGRGFWSPECNCHWSKKSQIPWMDALADADARDQPSTFCKSSTSLNHWTISRLRFGICVWKLDYKFIKNPSSHLRYIYFQDFNLIYHFNSNLIYLKITLCNSWGLPELSLAWALPPGDMFRALRRATISWPIWDFVEKCANGVWTVSHPTFHMFIKNILVPITLNRIGKYLLKIIY